MRRIMLLSLHLRTIYNLPDYAKIIKNQANTPTFEVRKDNIHFLNSRHDKSIKVYCRAKKN